MKTLAAILTTTLASGGLVGALPGGSNGTGPGREQRVDARGDAALATAEDRVLLAWKLAQGDTLRYRFDATSSSKQGDTTTTSKATLVLSWRVREVDADGVADVALSYTAVRLSVDQPSLASYDSTLTGDAAKANDAALARMLAPLLEAKASLRIRPDGRVMEVSGLREALERGVAAIQSAPPPMTVQGLMGFVDEASLRRFVEMNVLASQPMAVGGEWPYEFVQDLGGLCPLHAVMKSEIAGLETSGGHTIANLDVEGTLDVLPPVEGEERPFVVEVDESELVGVQTFDVTSGRMLQSTFDVDMTLAIRPAGGGSEPIEVTTTSHQTARLLATGDPDFEPATKKGQAKSGGK